MVSDGSVDRSRAARSAFQSALRFAVVSDHPTCIPRSRRAVSIRFEVRGGFRHEKEMLRYILQFQSALRFAVVSDGQSIWRTKKPASFNPL